MVRRSSIFFYGTNCYLQQIRDPGNREGAPGQKGSHYQRDQAALLREEASLKVSEERPDGESHGAVERKKEATEQEYEF